MSPKDRKDDSLTNLLVGSKVKGGIIGLFLTITLAFGGVSVKDVYKSQIMIEELTANQIEMEKKLDSKMDILQSMETEVAVQGIKLQGIEGDVQEIKQDVKEMLKRSNK